MLCRIRIFVTSYFKPITCDLLEAQLMLITEFDQELYEKAILEEGIEKGIKQGTDRLSRLCLELIREGRTDDLEQIMRDEDFRNEQFKIHNL